MASLAGVLACGGGGRTPETPRVNLESLPSLANESSADADVQAYVDLLVPYVERAAGAKFNPAPVGRAGNLAALAEILEVETREILGLIYDVPPEVIEKMAKSARAGIPGLLGKYAPSTGAVYFVPGASKSWEVEAGVPSARARTLLVMAHELAHALQDQQADFDQVTRKLEDLDHLDGFRGITEGHANWVTLRVARELSLEDEFWKLSAGQGWGKEGLIQPGAFPIFMVYGQGMKFCDYHATTAPGATGDPAELWPLVRQPPRSTTMLFRPDRYAADLTPAVDLAGKLSGVEQELTRAAWVPADTLLGEGPLRQETLGLDVGRVEKVLASVTWGHERQLHFSGDSNTSPRRGTVQVLGFADPAAARDLVALLSDGLDAQAKARSDLEKRLSENFPGMQARTWAVSNTPYEKIAGDAVLLRVAGPVSESGARQSSDEEQALFVVRGRVLVVVTVAGFRPGNRLDKAVEAVFSRLPPW
jgi:hypothetical protein